MARYRLSAHLYSFTKNSVYLSAAELTSQFIEDSSLFDGLVSSFDLLNCSVVQNKPDTESSGAFLEGVSIIADLTQNQTWMGWYVALPKARRCEKLTQRQAG